MLIGGLEKATSGKIFFQNHEITKLSEDEVSEIRRKEYWYYISVILFNS
jgi:putative ABC transport system ATP-binding protein